MQADGNFVIYGPSGEVYWATNTGNNWGSKLVLQNNGNLIIVNQQAKQTWASNSIDNTLINVPLVLGNTIISRIKWKSDVGMPSSNIVTDWLTVTSFGASLFEDNNNYTDTFNTWRGHFIDYKKLGKITFGTIQTEGDYKVLEVKVTDLPLAAPYEYKLELNPAVQWSGQNSKSAATLQSYSVGLQMGMTYTNGILRLAKTPHIDNIDAEITGYWSRMGTPNLQINPKILQPKPSDPVASPVIKTPIIIKSIIKQ